MPDDSASRKLARSGILALVCAFVLLAAGTANAATIHTPDDGTTVTQGQPVYFDWAWDDDEYATSWIGFAHSIDGPWTPKPEMTIQDCSYGSCGPWLSSHANLAIPVGAWYWRLCNKSIYVEDDKCSYDNVPPRALTVVAPPPPQTTTVQPSAPPDPNRLVQCSGSAQYGFFSDLTQRRTTCAKARRVMKLWIHKAWFADRPPIRSTTVLVYRCRFVMLEGADNPYSRITCKSASGKYVRFYGTS